MRLTSLLAGVCLASGALAQPTGEGPRARPQLIAERPIAMPGETVMLGIDFRIEEGWHTYWPGINDSGLSLDARLEASPGATLGELIWPAPHRYSPFEGILDHVFEERVTILLPVTIDEGVRPGSEITVEASLSWLVCETACIMESADLRFVLPVGTAAGKPDRDTVQAFARARARLPRPPKEDDGIRLEWDDESLSMTAIGGDRMAFYPCEGSRAPRDLFDEGETEGSTLVLRFRDAETPVKGVLEVWKGEKDESRVYWVQWPPLETEPIAPRETTGPAAPSITNPTPEETDE